MLKCGTICKICYDRNYTIGVAKLETELGWRADENFDSGIWRSIKEFN